MTYCLFLLCLVASLAVCGCLKGGGGRAAGDRDRGLGDER